MVARERGSREGVERDEKGGGREERGIVKYMVA